MTEKTWMSQVVELATLMRWTCYHTFDARRSAAGFPDLVLCRERLLLVELKAERGRVSPAQERWLTALRAAGQLVYLWRPGNWDEVVKVLT